MGVDMPIAAVDAILEEQQAWDRLRQKRTGPDFAQKRYVQYDCNPRIA
jgi:hypothetical protein